MQRSTCRSSRSRDHLHTGPATVVHPAGARRFRPSLAQYSLHRDQVPMLNKASLTPSYTPKFIRRVAFRSASIAMATSYPANASTAGDSAGMNSAKVAVFTTSGCPYCKRAKEALSGRSIAYLELDVSGAAELRALLKDVTGVRTVPQIFVGGAFLGGSDDLLAALQDGSFDNRYSSAQAPALPPEVQQLVENIKKEKRVTAATAGPSAETLALLQYLNTALPKRDVQQRFLAPALRKVFSGQQLLACLMEPACPQQQASREGAQQLARGLLEQQLVVAVATGQGAAAAEVVDSSEALYRLRSDAPAPAYGQPLNSHYQWRGPARDAVTVSEELRQRILQLYDRHLSSDGRAVSYRGIAADEGYAAYVDATAELQRVDLSPLSREQLMALFINLYNALIIHALVVYGPNLDAAQRATFFSTAAKYCIAGCDYSADDMENGVLRGNRPGAASLAALTGIAWLSRGPFGSSDPRLKHIVSPLDPRMHFALVCGAKSCPPIKLYTAGQLEEGLAGAAEAFCQSEVEVDKGGRLVRLSKIFKWYAVDFGGSQRERLEFLVPLLGGKARKELADMLVDGGGIKVVYKEYDWSTNSDE